MWSVALIIRIQYVHFQIKNHLIKRINTRSDAQDNTDPIKVHYVLIRCADAVRVIPGQGSVWELPILVFIKSQTG